MTKPRIGIVGGGLAGVTAAWQLAQLDPTLDVTLYEASPRCGGIVETVRRDGFLVECGPDSWVSEKPWARELAVELGLGEDLLPSLDATRKTYIVRGGKLVAMPDGMRMMVPGDLAAVDRSELFSDAAKQAFREEIANAEQLRANAPADDESVSSFVQRHFGEEVLATIGAPLLSGVFGGDVRTLSARAVMPAFVRMEEAHGSLIRAVQLAAPSGASSVFTTLGTGVGSLVDAMLRAIPPYWLRLNTPVTGLCKSGQGWTIATADESSEADVLLLATPAHVTSELFAALDTRIAALTQMDASSAIVAAFALMEPLELPQGFGFLVPPASGDADSLLAATFVDQKFAGRVPAGGRLIRAFFGGDAGARLLPLPDDEIAALAWSQLTTLLGTLPGSLFTIVRRWPRSLPQYAVGHLDRMAELSRCVQSHHGLSLLGNGYHGVGLPDVIRDARTAAHGVLASAE